MKATVYKCDVCGVERKEANHWFLFGYKHGDLTIGDWDFEEAEHLGIKHVCGQEHLNVLISRWIEEGQKRPTTEPVTLDRFAPADQLVGEATTKVGYTVNPYKCMICGQGHTAEDCPKRDYPTKEELERVL